jgi:GxxExxY protein
LKTQIGLTTENTDDTEVRRHGTATDGKSPIKNNRLMSKLIFEEESYHIRGAIFEVYRELGCGFLEAVYQECLYREFVLREIPSQCQLELVLMYKGIPLQQRYKPDFVCYEQVIVELKAVRELGPEHRAQLMNYLKATNLRLGFLVNFGSHPLVTIERFVR